MAQTFQELIGGTQEPESQTQPEAPDVVAPASSGFGALLGQEPVQAPDSVGEGLETGIMGTIINGIDYLGSRTRRTIRGLTGGDWTDGSSFVKEFTDPNSALGKLEPGGGIIPAVSHESYAATNFVKMLPATTLGIVADIFTDPLTFVTGGGGKGIQYGLKGAKVTLVSARQLTRAKRAVAPITDAVSQSRIVQSRAVQGTRSTLRSMFSTTPAGSDELADIALQEKNVNFRTTAATKDVYKDSLPFVAAQARLHRRYKGRASSDEINEMLVDAWETKPTGAPTYEHPLRDEIWRDADFRKIADEYADVFPESLARERAAGLETPEFGSGRQRIIGDLSDRAAELRSRREGRLNDYVDDLTKTVKREIRTYDKEIERLSQPSYKPVNQPAIDELTNLKLRAEDRLADAHIRMGERLQQTPGYLQRVEDRILQQRNLQELDPNYVLHTYTPQAKDIYRRLNPNLFGKGGRQFSTSHASQLQRQLLDDAKKYPTIAEFNKAGKDGNLMAFAGYEGSAGKGKLDFNVFETDPIRIAIERQLRALPKIENARLLDDVGRRYGQSIDDIAKSADTTADDLIRGADISEKYRTIRTADGTLFRETKSPLLEGKWFAPEVADHLDTYAKTAADPSEVANFIKGFDAVTNYWKGKTLSMFAAYHSRNVASNVWNNMLGGVGPKLSYYTRAAGIQNGKAGKVGDYTYDQIRQMARDLGIENQGWYSADIERTMSTALQDERSVMDVINNALFEDRSRLNPFKIDQTDLPSTLGRRAGTYLENNARLTHFVNKLEDGLAPQEAANSTFKYLFDYGDVTKFEKEGLIRAMPFYRWTRFNLPLQVESALKNPKHLAGLIHAKKGIESMPGNEKLEEQYVSDYIREGLGIQLRRRTDDEGNDIAEFFVLGNWLPSADLFKLAQIGQMDPGPIVDLMNPLLKVPAEIYFNYDSFRGRAIERVVDPVRDQANFFDPDGGEFGNFLGVPMRKKWIHVLRTMRLLSEIDRVNPGGKLDDIYTSDFIGGEGDRPGHPDIPAWERYLGHITGIRITGLDVNTAKSIELGLNRRATEGYRNLSRLARRRGDNHEADRLLRKANESVQGRGGGELGQ